MFVIQSPSPELAPLVKAYWLVKDLPGEYEGRLIRTSPIPLAILSVNIGRPNASEDGVLVPNVSLLGLQSRGRAWRSWSDTCFVMVMLTIPGLVRLFPHTGSYTADTLVDLGTLIGDAPALRLNNAIGLDLQPQGIADVLDKWLISRLNGTQAVEVGRQIALAHSILRRGGTVENAAEAARTGRRQLHRLFVRHLGIGPKELADLERFQLSLKSVQSGSGEPLDGFSDQAHQIRSWKRRLSLTPGAYARARTPFADHFSAEDNGSRIAYYL